MQRDQLGLVEINNEGRAHRTPFRLLTRRSAYSGTARLPVPDFD
jgi:hypothetical protein